jgi:hypothetical protein
MYLTLHPQLLELLAKLLLFIGVLVVSYYITKLIYE